MINIKATYDDETNKITLELSHNKETEVIEASVRPSGKFRFSYHHPELDKPDSYQGMFISDTKFVIYPMFGVGVISQETISLESDN